MNRLNSASYLFPKSALCHLIDDSLIHAFAAFLSLCDDISSDLLPADIHKRRQMCQCKGLSSILITCHLCHDLSRNITCGKEAMWFLDQSLADNGSILKHVFQVNQITVMLFLCKIIRIVEMNNSFLMRFHNLIRKQNTSGKILTDFSCHIISLRRVNYRVLIGVFLIHFLINVFNQRQNPVVRCIGFSIQFSFIAIANILLRHLIAAHFHNSGLYHILNVFYIHRMHDLVHLIRNIIRNCHNLIIVHSVKLVYLLICLSDRIYNLTQVKLYFFPVPLNYACFHFHICTIPSLISSLYYTIYTKYRRNSFVSTLYLGLVTIIQQNIRFGKREFSLFLF